MSHEPWTVSISLESITFLVITGVGLRRVEIESCPDFSVYKWVMIINCKWTLTVSVVLIRCNKKVYLNSIKTYSLFHTEICTFRHFNKGLYCS